MSNGGTVNISPEELIRVCDACIKNIKDYRDNQPHKTIKVFKLSKMAYEEVKHFEYKSWAAYSRGIEKRLVELRAVATAVKGDESVIDRDIQLTLTTHINLYKLYCKEISFQPDVFGLGY